MLEAFVAKGCRNHTIVGQSAPKKRSLHPKPKNLETSAFSQMDITKAGQRTMYSNMEIICMPWDKRQQDYFSIASSLLKLHLLCTTR